MQYYLGDLNYYKHYKYCDVDDLPIFNDFLQIKCLFEMFTMENIIKTINCLNKLRI